MSYSASVDVFYGALMPEGFEMEDTEIEKAGFIPVFYGNYVTGDCGSAIAIKTISASESEAKELGLDFSEKEQKDLEKLKKFLKKNKIEAKISWYCAASYG